MKVKVIKAMNDKTGDIPKLILHWSAISKIGGDVAEMRSYCYSAKSRHVKRMILKKAIDGTAVQQFQWRDYGDNPHQDDENKMTIELVVAANMDEWVMRLLFIHLKGMLNLMKRFSHFEFSIHDRSEKDGYYRRTMSKVSSPIKYGVCKDQIEANIQKYGCDIDSILIDEYDDNYMDLHRLKIADIPGRNGAFCHAEIAIEPLHAQSASDSKNNLSMVQVKLIKDGHLEFPISETEPILSIIVNKVDWSKYAVNAFVDGAWRWPDDHEECVMQTRVKCRNQKQWELKLTLMVLKTAQQSDIILSVERAIDKLKGSMGLSTGIANISSHLAVVVNEGDTLKRYKDFLLNDSNESDMQRKLYEMMVNTVDNDDCKEQDVTLQDENDDEKEQSAENDEMELDESDDDDNKNQNDSCQ